MLTKSSLFCERFFAILVISMCICLLFDASEARLFQYPRYTYRKKGGNQRRYKVKETHCEGGCSVLGGLEKTVCERQCISDKCYKELYAWDELEEGEIDVRLNSFKGCSVQDIKKTEQ